MHSSLFSHLATEFFCQPDYNGDELNVINISMTTLRETFRSFEFIKLTQLMSYEAVRRQIKKFAANLTKSAPLGLYPVKTRKFFSQCIE